MTRYYQVQSRKYAFLRVLNGFAVYVRWDSTTEPKVGPFDPADYIELTEKEALDILNKPKRVIRHTREHMMAIFGML